MKQPRETASTHGPVTPDAAIRAVPSRLLFLCLLLTETALPAAPPGGHWTEAAAALLSDEATLTLRCLRHAAITSNPFCGSARAGILALCAAADCGSALSGRDAVVVQVARTCTNRAGTPIRASFAFTAGIALSARNVTE